MSDALEYLPAQDTLEESGAQLLTASACEPEEGPDLLAQFSPPDQLSQEVINLAQYAIRKRQSRSPTVKQNIVEQFNSTFQLIGGVPRLALWADKNPTAFYALYSKMIPAAIKLDATSLDPNALHEDDLKDISTEKLKIMLYRRAQELDPDPHGS